MYIYMTKKNNNEYVKSMHKGVSMAKAGVIWTTK